MPHATLEINARPCRRLADSPIPLLSGQSPVEAIRP